MEIDEQRLREFIEAYREEFNEDLPDKKARILLTQLVEFYIQIARPLPNDTLVCAEDDSSMYD